MAVEVVDRGSREIVVFLRGDVGEADEPGLAAAIDEVDLLEKLTGLSRVVVDCHDVTSLGQSGIDFLHRLSERGERHGFSLSLSALSEGAHHGLEDGEWPGVPPTWMFTHDGRPLIVERRTRFL